MNIKHVTTAFILASAIFTQASFAADTQPQATANNAENQSTAANTEQFPPRFAQKLAQMKFFKDYKEKEGELLKDLRTLNREEAETRLTDFYTGVFESIPDRNSRFSSRVTAMINDLDLPAEVKEEVIAKLDNYPAAQTQQMQEEVINFAKSLLDLPAGKRENAIAGYNEYVARFIIGNGGKRHNMDKGPNHMGRMGRGMDFNKGNCPAADFNGAPEFRPMMPMQGRGMGNPAFSMLPPRQQMNPAACMNNPGFNGMQPGPERHGHMRGFSDKMARPDFMGMQPQAMNMRNCPFPFMGMQPNPQMQGRAPMGFPPAMPNPGFNGNIGPRCPMAMQMQGNKPPMPCPWFNNMPKAPEQMNNMPEYPNAAPNQSFMGMPGRHHERGMNKFKQPGCRQNFQGMPPFMKNNFQRPDPRFYYGPQAPATDAPEGMMQTPPPAPQDEEQIPEDQPAPQQPENE